MGRRAWLGLGVPGLSCLQWPGCRHPRRSPRASLPAQPGPGDTPFGPQGLSKGLGWHGCPRRRLRCPPWLGSRRCARHVPGPLLLHPSTGVYVANGLLPLAEGRGF